MKENIETTEKILRKAHKEKRSTLFEHEVYGILKGMGIRTPVHIFIRDVNEITSNTLSLFKRKDSTEGPVSRDSPQAESRRCKVRL